MLPIGAITKGRKGQELAEMALMHAAGAVGFSDDGIGVASAAVMLKDRNDEDARRKIREVLQKLAADSNSGLFKVYEGDDARKLGPVPLRTSRHERVGLSDAAASGSDHVDSREHAVREVRVRGIDPGIEERDRDSAPVLARHRETRERGRRHGTRTLVHGHRISDPHRIHPLDLVVTVEQVE